MHCLTEADWTDRYRGVMDVLSEAKEQGIIRSPRMLMPQYRGSAGRGEISLGGS